MINSFRTVYKIKFSIGPSPRLKTWTSSVWPSHGASNNYERLNFNFSGCWLQTMYEGLSYSDSSKCNVHNHILLPLLSKHHIRLTGYSSWSYAGSESFIPVKSGTMQPKRPFDDCISRRKGPWHLTFLANIEKQNLTINARRERWKTLVEHQTSNNESCRESTRRRRFRGKGTSLINGDAHTSSQTQRRKTFENVLSPRANQADFNIALSTLHTLFNKFEGCNISIGSLHK